MLLRVTLVAICLLSTACASKNRITAGRMPAGADFSGVWQSPQYGSMHICLSGDDAIGDYVLHDRSGTIQGNVIGDILKFRWDDKRELVKDHPKKTSGHGYFRMHVDQDGLQYLKGEWGLGDDLRGGGPWNAVKLLRKSPDRCLLAEKKKKGEVKELDWGD